MGLRPARETVEKQGEIARPPTNTSAAAIDHAPSRDAFAKLWDRPLRRPLYDPPPPKVEVKEPPPLAVDLVGTIVEMRIRWP